MVPYFSAPATTLNPRPDTLLGLKMGGPSKLIAFSVGKAMEEYTGSGLMVDIGQQNATVSILKARDLISVLLSENRPL